MEKVEEQYRKWQALSLEDHDEIFRVEVGNKRLVITFGEVAPSPHKADASFEEAMEVVKNHFDELYLRCLSVNDKETYLLNLCDDERLGRFSWNSSTGRRAIRRVLGNYNVFIQAFILWCYK